MNHYLAAIYRNDEYTLGKLLSEHRANSQRLIDESLRVIISDHKLDEHICRTFSESLLLVGANPDGYSANGYPFIYDASSRGEKSLVELLINFSCDVNATSGDEAAQQCALHEAAVNGHIDIVGLLIAAGASCNMQDIAGNTPLNLAYTRLNPDAEVISLLLIDGDVNIADYAGRSPLHNVVIDTTIGLNSYPFRKNPHVTIREVKRLISLGACVNCQSKIGETPLMMAVEFGGDGNLEVVKCLLDAGSNVNITDIHGRTALHRSCEVTANNDKVVQFLLDAGANVNSRTKLAQHTPLFLAVRAQKIDRVHMLIEANCNLDLTGRSFALIASADSPVRTPIEVATTINALPIVKMLLIAGCNAAPFRDKLQYMMKTEMNQTDSYVSETRKQLEELEELINELSHPTKLAKLCRRKIRRCVGSHIKKKADQLNLPQAMTDFVLLKSLADLCMNY